MLALALVAALAACSPQPQAAKEGETPAPAATAAAPDVSNMPAGEYKIDPTHSTLVFRVSHLGFSNYTASFGKFDATLQIDPANVSAGSLSATIDARSLTLPAPPPGFQRELLGPQWLDAAHFPQITFRSTAIESTGANTARITGDLTLHGVTKPVTLEATYNGGYPGHAMDPNARIGFSAHGTFKRSDFGVAYGVPAPGTTMGVSDDVEVIIETEFTGPPLAQAPAAPDAAKQN